MSKVVLLDAVGTILKTSPGVIEVYHSHALRHGSALTVAEIKARFKDSRKRLFDLETSAKRQTAGQLVSSDSIEHQLWFQLIEDVFVDVADPKPLFEELWQFFANPGNWQLFYDTAATLESLKSAGYLIGIASNFDSRLQSIVSAIPELGCVDFVYCSADIGFRKPDPAFYSTVETKIHLKNQPRRRHHRIFERLVESPDGQITRGEINIPGTGLRCDYSVAVRSRWQW